MSNSKKRNAAAIARLADAFPATFFIEPARRRPLRIGIAADIAAKINGAIEPEALHVALCSYCGSPSYLRSFKVGAPRVDLSGDEAGVITAGEAEHARAKLDALLARRRPKPAPQPQATADRVAVRKQKMIAADPDRAIAAALGAALETAAEARKQKPAAAEPVRQPKGDGFAALKAAAARRRETVG